jgi:predicted RNase H-like nuclease/gamma-glutamylcyclotransferase (GGCT)/AIG2-like uncharacterized protein YtfP
MVRSSLLFVYGTLMRGHAAASVLGDAPWEGVTWLDGADLHDAGAYPMACDGTGAVRGECRRIDPARWPELDAYEDVPWLYRRERRQLRDGRWAFVYLVSAAMAVRHPPLPSGIWPRLAPAGIRRLRGVDGCRLGWLLLEQPQAGGTVVGSVSADAEALACDDDSLCAVDMPIGLPDREPRQCDSEARRLLGPRRASVFSAPLRPLLAASDHAQACQWSRELQGRGLSIQSWNLMPRIRDLDRLLQQRPEQRPRLHEVHPELSFRELNGSVPLPFAKKTLEGRACRRGLLEPLFPGAFEDLRRQLPRQGVADDDLLDALVLLWSAGRLAAGLALALGDPDARDGTGLPLRIQA